MFCGAREQPRKLMDLAGFADVVGRENICDNVLEALARAKAIYEPPPSQVLKHRPGPPRPRARRLLRAPGKRCDAPGTV